MTRLSNRGHTYINHYDNISEILFKSSNRFRVTSPKRKWWCRQHYNHTIRVKVLFDAEMKVIHKFPIIGMTYRVIIYEWTGQLKYFEACFTKEGALSLHTTLHKFLNKIALWTTYFPKRNVISIKKDCSQIGSQQ